MLNRRKVAGVLAEGRDGVIVLGMGINVNQRLEELPDARVAPGSLRTADGVVRERAPLLALLLARLEREYDLWREGGIDAVFDRLGARDFLRGRAVSVDGISGNAVGITRSGELAIDVDGERRLVEAGEVTYER